MQNLYMVATQIREQEMQKMAIQVISGLLNVEQAMSDYNVSSKEAVLQRVESFKKATHSIAEQQSGFIDMNVQAA